MEVNTDVVIQPAPPTAEEVSTLPTAEKEFKEDATSEKEFKEPRNSAEPASGEEDWTEVTEPASGEEDWTEVKEPATAEDGLPEPLTAEDPLSTASEPASTSSTRSASQEEQNSSWEWSLMKKTYDEYQSTKLEDMEELNADWERLRRENPRNKLHFDLMVHREEVRKGKAEKMRATEMLDAARHHPLKKASHDYGIEKEEVPQVLQKYWRNSVEGTIISEELQDMELYEHPTVDEDSEASAEEDTEASAEEDTDEPLHGPGNELAPK